MMTVEERRERNRARSATYRLAHPEESRAKCRTYYHAHRERIREQQNAAYRTNPEKQRADCERAAAWFSANRERALARSRVYDRAHRAQKSATSLVYYHAHPKDRPFARAAVARALAVGTLQRPADCERCGAPGVQAHHDDYSKQLDVRWFCLRCHQQADRARRQREQLARDQEQVA